MKINENKLAVLVSECEGLKVQTNIAQIKEIQKIVLDALAEHMADGNWSGVAALLEKHAPKE